MSLCSVADVRAIAFSRSVTDTEITAIITSVSKNVAAQTGGSESSTDTLLVLAGTHLAAAEVLRLSRQKGEFAARVKSGNAEQQNTIDPDIEKNEAAGVKYIKKYNHSSGRGGIIYSRVGPGTVNEELE